MADIVDVSEILSEARETLIESIKQDVLSNIKWSITRQLDNEIGPIIKEFVATEIAPEIRSRLVGQKSEILKAATDQIPEIASKVVGAIVKQMAENLGKSYQADKIIKALTE